MESAPRKLIALQSRIDALGPNEHGVLLDMVTKAGVRCARNANGYFFDLSSVEPELLASIEQFVCFSVDNNRDLDRHDRSMHDQVQLLQRIPVARAANAAPSARRPPSSASRSERPVATTSDACLRGAKLAFVRRASDAPARRRIVADVVEEADPPIALGKHWGAQ